MSVAVALASLVDALERAGMRTAVRDGDITPPVVYVQIATTGAAGIPMTGGTLTGFWMHYIPVRGVDNIAGEADALDAIRAALTPLAMTELTSIRSSVTVRNDSWPCHRFDATLLATPAVLKG
jgi:hypothetical protein